MGRALGKDTMTDNDDWRRRKAEELGLVNDVVWLSPTPRAGVPKAGVKPSQTPEAGTLSDTVQNHGAEAKPVRALSDIPDDAILIDRRRRPQTGKNAGRSPSPPIAALPFSARHPRVARPAAMLAILAGLALALAFGWWLRGAAALDNAPLAVDKSRDSIPVSGPQKASSAEATSVGNTPTVATPPAALPPAEGLSTGASSAPERMRAPRPLLPAPRGRFTAPRAVAAPGQDFSPSFNCRRATSWVNRTVCSDAELAALDVRMSDTYGAAIAAADPAGERRIDADQAQFLQQRARCRTADCIGRAYRMRIDELALSN